MIIENLIENPTNADAISKIIELIEANNVQHNEITSLKSQVNVLNQKLAKDMRQELLTFIIRTKRETGETHFQSFLAKDVTYVDYVLIKENNITKTEMNIHLIDGNIIKVTDSLILGHFMQQYSLFLSEYSRTPFDEFKVTISRDGVDRETS